MSQLAATVRGTGPKIGDFSRVLRGEGTKLASFQGTRIGLLLALVGGALGSVAFAATVRLTRGVDATQLSDLERLQISMLGADIANIVMIIVGILFVFGEKSSGMIRTSLSLSPRRIMYMFGKVLVLFIPSVIVSVVICWLAHLSGRLVFAVLGAHMYPISDPHVQRIIWGTSLMIPFYVLLAAALGFVFRSGIVAFLGVFLVMCLPTLSSILPSAAERAVQWILPAPVMHSLSGAAQPGEVEYTSPMAAAVLLVWVVVFLGVAAVIFRRSDF
ncbi:MAG: ABC transporter permease subunit [Actinomycetales bacterium]